MAGTDVPDLNLWLALADGDHEHHERARHYWEAEAAAEIAFCRVTMLGFFRLLTNARVMHGASMSPAEAWAAYHAFAALPEVCFLNEQPTAEQHFHALTQGKDFTPLRWTDAWIAAMARACSARVVSFDAAFRTFPDLEFLHLR